MEKIFNNERTLFQNRINELAKQGTTVSNIDLLIKAQLNRKNDDMGKRLSDLYDILGLDEFIDLIELIESIGGGYIFFPSLNEINETVQAALTYYLQVVKEKNIATNSTICDSDMSVSKITNRINQMKTLKSCKNITD